MKCPNCSTELKRRERSNYTCSACRQPFALDPKLDPLGLHDLRVRDLDRKLSDGGTLRYTAEQLLYSAAAKVVAAQKPARLPIGCALIIGGVALIVIADLAHSLLIGGLFGLGIMLIVLALRQWMRNRPFYRKLPIDLRTFERQSIGRILKVYTALPSGLIASDAPLIEPVLPPDRLRGALVCPVASIRRCLLANNIPIQCGLALLPAAPPFTDAQQAYLVALRSQPDLPILLLHDASPAGCLLAATVTVSLGLTAAHPLRDLGLTPGAVRPQQLVLGAPPDAAQIARLRALGALPEAELEWLAAGHVAPLAAVPPARLIKLIKSALPKTAAEQPAQAFGFMSWPTQEAEA